MRPRAWRGSCGRALWDISGKHGAGLARWLTGSQVTGSTGSTGSTGFRWQASAVFANPGAPKEAGQLTRPNGPMAHRGTRAVVLHSRASRRQAAGRPVAGPELCPGSDATADRPNQRDGGPAAPGAWPFRTEATRTPHSRFGERWCGQASLVKVCVSRLGNSPRLRCRLRLSTTHHTNVALPSRSRSSNSSTISHHLTAPARQRQHQLGSASSRAELHPPAGLD
jgi:hypothetical protein